MPTENSHTFEYKSMPLSEDEEDEKGRLWKGTGWIVTALLSLALWFSLYMIIF